VLWFEVDASVSTLAAHGRLRAVLPYDDGDLAAVLRTRARALQEAWLDRLPDGDVLACAPIRVGRVRRGVLLLAPRDSQAVSDDRECSVRAAERALTLASDLAFLAGALVTAANGTTDTGRYESAHCDPRDALSARSWRGVA
jgi:hypothetical protein